MAQMTAAFCIGRRSIEVRPADVPSTAAGEVLLRVRACGICGTDLHFYHGDLPVMPSASPGHEFAGEVAAVGEGASRFAVGERVVCEPIRCCRSCSYCLTGRHHLCPRRVLLGTIVPGGLAEYVAVPEYTLYPLPDTLDFELGALAEPLAVAVHGLHIVDLRMGERVLVMGSGTIGVLAVLAARYAGAGEVFATYRHDHQGRAALAAGADRIVPADDAGSLAGKEIDVVVETVGGTAPTLTQALGVVRRGGRISVLGLFTQPAPINALNLMLNEAMIVGGVTYCRPGQRSDFEIALDILESEKERARRVITHRFPLDKAADAFAAAADKSSGSLKVQVQA